VNLIADQPACLVELLVLLTEGFPSDQAVEGRQPEVSVEAFVDTLYPHITAFQRQGRLAGGEVIQPCRGGPIVSSPVLMQPKTLQTFQEGASLPGVEI